MFSLGEENRGAIIPRVEEVSEVRPIGVGAADPTEGCVSLTRWAQSEEAPASPARTGDRAGRSDVPSMGEPSSKCPSAGGNQQPTGEETLRLGHQDMPPASPLQDVLRDPANKENVTSSALDNAQIAEYLVCSIMLPRDLNRMNS